MIRFRPRNMAKRSGTWSEWAQEANGWDGKDVGIDLVAKLRNEEGFAAIQAKFYCGRNPRSRKRISTASSRPPGRSRSGGGWFWTRQSASGATNAEEMIRGQAIPVVRIGLTDLRESRIEWTVFEARGEIVLADEEDPAAAPARCTCRDVSGGPGCGRPWQDDHGVRHRQNVHLP